MPMPGMTTRAAQPPGGRSSFSFNDGSDSRMARLPPPQAPPPPRGGYAQEPGGHTSWAFDDRQSRGQEEESNRRHTNGLLKRSNPASVPSGGRTKIDLSDGSSAPAPRFGGHDGDALDQFVRSSNPPSSRQHAPPGGHSTISFSEPSASDGDGFSHRAQLAPPGGQSSFTLGWGEDNYVNHHRHYNGGRDNPPPSMDYAARDHSASVSRDPSANNPFSRAFSVDGVTRKVMPQTLQDQGVAGFGVGFGCGGVGGMNRTARAPQDQGSVGFVGGGGGGGYGGGGVGGGGYGGGGYGIGVRSSTRVAAPPGGTSSIVFG